MKKFCLLVLLFCMLDPLARATVTGTSNNVSFTCSDSTGPYSFSFPAYDSSAVQVIETVTATSVETLLTSSDYSISPTGGNYMNGGGVTLVTACPSGDTLTILRETGQTQTSQFVENMPALYSTFEVGLDKLTMEIQDINNGLVNQIFSGSPTLTGNPSFLGAPTAVTQAPGDASTKLATDEFVQASLPATGANLTLSNLTNPTSINVPALDFQGDAGMTALGLNHPVTLTPSGSANVIIGANGLQFPDATVQTTAATGGGVSDSTMMGGSYLAGSTAACTTTNSSCFVYIFPNAHTLVRVAVKATVAPAGCSTNAQWGVIDLTASSVLEALTPTATGILDSGAISVSMPAGHQIGVGITQTDVGCGTQPVAGVTATFE